MRYLRNNSTKPTASETDAVEEYYPVVVLSNDNNELTYCDYSYLTVKYNIPEAGTYKLLGQRSVTRYFSAFTDNCIAMYINDEQVTPSLSYTFDNAGEYNVKFVLKHAIPSLYCLFTNRQTIEKEIDVSHLDTRENTDMSFAFEGLNGCDSIKCIDKLDVSNVTSMFCMFQDCSCLTSISDLSNWNTSNVTDMGYMFNGYKTTMALTSIGDLSNWNTSKVTDMHGMFSQCNSLTSIGDLSNWNTSKVTDMHAMFSQCNSLTSVGDLSNWNTSKVTNMYSLFNESNSLTSVGNLSNWNTANVTNMSLMFNGYKTPMALTSIGDLSNWNTSKVTDMCGMFCQCSLLISVGDLSNWNTSNVTDMSFMFSGYKTPMSLTSIGDLSNWDTSKVTDMDCMFCQCSLLTSVGDLSNWNTSNVTNMSYMFNQQYSSKSLWVTMEGIPPIPKGCKTEYMYSNLNKLTTIEKAGKISASVSFKWSPLTRESALVIINALDSENTGTLTLSSSTYALLTEDDIKIATDKGWTIGA